MQTRPPAAVSVSGMGVESRRHGHVHHTSYLFFTCVVRSTHSWHKLTYDVWARTATCIWRHGAPQGIRRPATPREDYVGGPGECMRKLEGVEQAAVAPGAGGLCAAQKHHGKGPVYIYYIYI